MWTGDWRLCCVIQVERVSGCGDREHGAGLRAVQRGAAGEALRDNEEKARHVPLPRVHAEA